MAGESRYGWDDYGDGKYSVANYDYADASMDVTITFLTADMKKVRDYIATMTLGVSFATPADMEVINGFFGDIILTFPLSASSIEMYRQMGASMAPVTDLAGDIMVYRSVHFNAEMEVITAASAGMSNILRYNASMSVEVDLESDPYIGRYWEDDQPDQGLWVDESGATDPWSDTTAPQPNWN